MNKERKEFFWFHFFCKRDRASEAVALIEDRHLGYVEKIGRLATQIITDTATGESREVEGIHLMGLTIEDNDESIAKLLANASIAGYSQGTMILSNPAQEDPTPVGSIIKLNQGDIYKR